jgi:zinc/manganese transport system substrate-binding protein
MTRRRQLLVIVATIGFLAGACSPTAGEEAERPVVAVSTNILADVVGVLAGDDVEVLDLMPRGADPHSFGLSAAQAAQVESAHLVVTNGLGLEEGLVARLEALATTGVPIVEIGPFLEPIPYGDDVAAQGPSIDPHVWTDPIRMITAVEVLADLLTELQPSAADRIAARAETYAAALRELHSWIEEELDVVPFERRRLVTNHHVFGYFADRYGFEVVGAIIPSGTTLASPSAADLAGLATQIRAAGVSTIFAESSQPTRLAEVLASEVELDVQVVTLFTESLGPIEGEAGTYLDMMRFNARAIVASLG